MSAEEGINNEGDTLVKTVTKLLDKAGKDPRLTPRILREKAEQRLSLSKGDLKPQREKIKDIIWDWWEKQKTAQLDREAAILKSLVKLARVSGNVPGAVKGMNELPTMNEKIVTLRDRLRAKGLIFSDVPTEAETAAAEKAYQLKQDLDGIDPSLIVSSSRKRPGAEAPVAVKTEKPASYTAETNAARSAGKVDAPLLKSEKGANHDTSNAGSAAASTAHAANASVPAAKKARIEYSDEEAEF